MRNHERVRKLTCTYIHSTLAVYAYEFMGNYWKLNMHASRPCGKNNLLKTTSLQVCVTSKSASLYIHVRVALAQSETQLRVHFSFHQNTNIDRANKQKAQGVINSRDSHTHTHTTQGKYIQYTAAMSTWSWCCAKA